MSTRRRSNPGLSFTSTQLGATGTLTIIQKSTGKTVEIHKGAPWGAVCDACVVIPRITQPGAHGAAIFHMSQSHAAIWRPTRTKAAFSVLKTLQDYWEGVSK